MHKFSLINVSERKEGLVSGVWLQDFNGDKEGAFKLAKNTEEANGNRIGVAIVERLGGGSPNYNYLTNVKEMIYND
jgi:hypothetical protein